MPLGLSKMSPLQYVTMTFNSPLPNLNGPISNTSFIEPNLAVASHAVYLQSERSRQDKQPIFPNLSKVTHKKVFTASRLPIYEIYIKLIRCPIQCRKNYVILIEL